MRKIEYDSIYRPDSYSTIRNGGFVNPFSSRERWISYGLDRSIYDSANGGRKFMNRDKWKSMGVDIL